eukprot:2504416-Pyramimonas_sp.AAC.1
MSKLSRVNSSCMASEQGSLWLSREAVDEWRLTVVFWRSRKPRPQHLDLTMRFCGFFHLRTQMPSTTFVAFED